MNKAVIPTLIGALTSLLTIWLIHTLLIVNDCSDKGGTFEYATAECLLENGEIFKPSIEEYMLALYFVIGFGVSFFVSNILRKYLRF